MKTWAVIFIDKDKYGNIICIKEYNSVHVRDEKGCIYVSECLQKENKIIGRTYYAVEL